MTQRGNIQKVRWPIPIAHQPSRRLSEEEFEWTLVAGLGRAVTAWAAQEHELSDVLLAAALETPSIDAQVDSRHAWIASMIENATEPAFYVNRVVAAGVELARYGHTRDSYHRIGIIQYFAHRDEFGCREWMLENMLDGRLEEEWIEVAGWEGIVDVARARGASGELDYEVDPFMFAAYRWAARKVSEVEVLERLETEAKANSDIAAYLESLRGWMRHEPDSSPDESVGRVWLDFSHIDPGLTGPQLRTWFKTATNAQLEWVLGWLERSKSDDRWRMISAWTRWGPPLHRFSPQLYEWSAAHTVAEDDAETISPDKLLGAHSMGLLGTLDDPRVRELGLTRIESGNVEGGFALLGGNWQPEDAALLTDSLPLVIPATLDSRYEHHGLAYTVNDLTEVVDDERLIPAARWVYLLNPCANCRSTAVGWLRKKNAFGSALAAEYENDVWNHETPVSE